MPKAQPSEEINWYAVRTKRLANQGQRVTVEGAEYRSYKDRKGYKRKKRIPDTGRKVFTVERLLRKQGFEVFLPTRQVYRTKSRYTKEKHLVTYPLLAGWVFVGWADVQYRWNELFNLSFVHEVAGIDGKPLCLSSSEMKELFMRWGGRRMQAPERERFMRTHHEFKLGDSVKIADGPLNGVEVKVIDIHDDKARILLDLLGKMQEIEIDTMQLSAA